MDFLMQTKLTEPDQAIKDLGDKLFKEANGDTWLYIQKVWEWVRENIGYWFVPLTDTAADTLNKGRGVCTQKANLTISLLRYKNIPAGYKLVTFDQTDVYELLYDEYIQYMKSRSRQTTTHVYAFVIYNDKEYGIDNTYDRLTRKICCNSDLKTNEWDKRKYIDVNKQYIIKEETKDNIDYLLNMKRNEHFDINEANKYLYRKKLAITQQFISYRYK